MNCFMLQELAGKVQNMNTNIPLPFFWRYQHRKVGYINMSSLQEIQIQIIITFKQNNSQAEKGDL
jgi:hypothetical protein